MPTLSPYGSWPSTLSAECLTQQSAKYSEARWCGDHLFWLESRPNEKGRNALVTRNASGDIRDLLPAPHSVRTRANEYGGGSYLVTPRFIVCVLDADQRVYLFDRTSETLKAISPENTGNKTHFRFADFCWDEKRQRILCIREDHTGQDRFEQSAIIAFDITAPYSIKTLVSGADFYSNPQLSPDGNQLSFLSWNHPQMPWDGTECSCALLNDAGDTVSFTWIAGSKDESIFQPQWSPTGELFFVSDKNNWWNIYRHNAQSTEIVCALDAEFATPQWVFGMSTFGFLNEENLFCCYTQKGVWYLGSIDIASGRLSVIESDSRDISGIQCDNNKACFFAASATQSTQLYLCENSAITAITPPKPAPIADSDISSAEAISYTTTDGDLAHAFYYAPKNSHYTAPENTLPPLIVMCHGGPTAATETSLNIKIQFWTHRGFAVLDVNYRGSTGYGRAYRDKLKRNWGVTDVIDASSGAAHLIALGLVDKKKIAIRGSSAGGYTVLAALTFTDIFTIGASLYGIGDLEALARDTHKFEAHYLDNLVGQYPEEKALYQSRSPIHHIEQLHCPVIFFQGLQDKVVPPAQAEAMVNALQEKGIRTAYITFDNEGHGFRQAENIQRAIEAELDFYQTEFRRIDDELRTARQ